MPSKEGLIIVLLFLSSDYDNSPFSLYMFNFNVLFGDDIDNSLLLRFSEKVRAIIKTTIIATIILFLSIISPVFFKYFS